MQISITITDLADGSAAVAWHTDLRKGARLTESKAHEVAAYISGLLEELNGMGAVHTVDYEPKSKH